MSEPPLSPGRRWAITVTVMLVSILQILDTSVTNVALPQIQGPGLGDGEPASQRHCPLQRGPQHRGQRRHRHRDHAPEPPIPGPPGHAGGARARVGSRDDRASPPVDRALPRPRRGHDHGRPAVSGVFAGLGPFVTGVLRDARGDYGLALVLAALINAAALLFLPWARPPREPRRRFAGSHDAELNLQT
jgi:hypothetical protein